MLAACDHHSCTDIGCMQSATLRFRTPLSEAGEYRLRAIIDGTSFECTAFVPLRRDGSEPVCETMFVNRQEITTRTDDAVTGRAGDPITSVSFTGDIGSIALTVTRDGVELLSTEVSPEYRGVEINGEGCGECPMAEHTIGE